MSEQTRLTARAVADALADRLADPRAIPVGDLPGESRHVNVSEVEAGTLGRGHSGISLLFSSRATGNSAAAAHGHLQRCSQLLRKLPQPGIGMQAHLTGLGFAMLAARTATGGYGQALAQLDGHICRAAEVLCAPATAGSRELDRFDAISGLTGIGRYLLLRGEPVVRTTEKVLDRLTSMALEGTGPSASAGGDLPAFWADEPPPPTSRPTPTWRGTAISTSGWPTGSRDPSYCSRSPTHRASAGRGSRRRWSGCRACWSTGSSTTRTALSGPVTSPGASS